MIGVLPSIGPEAFGIVLLEAMASGKPVIASTAGGIPDIVEDNVSGLLVRPGDPRGLAQAMGALVTDEPFRGRLAAGAPGRRRRSRLRTSCRGSKPSTGMSWTGSDPPPQQSTASHPSVSRPSEFP